MDFDIEFTAGGFIISLLLALLVFWIAKRNYFFKLPPPSLEVPVTFVQTLGAFLIYLIFALLILPLFVIFLILSKTGHIANLKSLPQSTISWLQVVSLWILTLLLLLYCRFLRLPTRHFIFWGEGEKSSSRFWKSFGMGVLTCVISYPFVLFTGIVAKFISLQIWGKIDVEQVAVKQLELTIGKHFLFSLMILAIIVVVPLAEELLFRGFLQNFLKRHFGYKWAIAISAIVFAFAHFSLSQGAGNFQLILTLGILAFFLGFIYERQRTLWASYGLHVTFNAFNVLLILLTNK